MPKPQLTLRDWLFGAGGKRRVLEALLTGTPRAWTETELARASLLHLKGSVDIHITALVQLGVLVESGNSYVVEPNNPLVEPLRQLVELIAAVEDAKLKRPPPARGSPSGPARPRR